MAANNAKKNFNDQPKMIDSPHTIHQPLPAATQALFDNSEGAANPPPRSIYCGGNGNLVIKDSAGTTATYPVVTGVYILSDGCQEVEVTTDIATVLVW